MTTQKLSIECLCNSPEHSFMFMMDDDPSWEMSYLYVHLNKLSFWQRVVYAVRYIFGYQSKYGCFDEVCLTQADLDKIVDYIKRVQDVRAKTRSSGVSPEVWTPESSGSFQSSGPQTPAIPKLSIVKIQHDRVPDEGDDPMPV